MNLRQDFHRQADYRNPDVLAIGRRPAHPRYHAYASVEEALAGEGSARVLSLDGDYDFVLVPRPEEAGAFYEPGQPMEGAQTIVVPGNWETQGFGEPIYTNHHYPWDYDPERGLGIRAKADGPGLPHPPAIPDENPTGCYRRTFTLPEGFLGQRLFLSFEGVETAFYVWLNGEPVGYSQDSKLAAEFEVTAQAQAGENCLAVQVMRFADSSYLEDQDYWYLSGIYRSVRLIAKPDAHLEDYRITTTTELATRRATLNADLRVSRVEGYAEQRVRVGVYRDGERLALGEGEVAAQSGYDPRQPTAARARVTLALEDVALWSPDEPTLYDCVIELLDGEGRVVDVEACRTGFREISLEGGIVRLNGERLIVRGVNRHEHGPDGRTLTRAHMREEIRQMKRMNINSVRTSHYPDGDDWYELCDELGILVICEANLETHGVMGQLSHDPAWSAAYLERAVRMVQQHGNHVSIYAWSLGNESGYGANHAAMYGYIKQADPTRLCQYEAGGPPANISDIRGTMYATIRDIMGMLTDPDDTRPVILVEYLYQMRNSGGGVGKFLELTERHPRFQGGYVWDWQDKGLRAKTPDGGEHFGYGGDFGESYTDPTEPLFMTHNGVVLSDLRWKPVAHALKQVYSPILVERVRARAEGWEPYHMGDRFVIKNRSFSRCLSDYRIEAALRADGEVIA